MPSTEASLTVKELFVLLLDGKIQVFCWTRYFDDHSHKVISYVEMVGLENYITDFQITVSLVWIERGGQVQTLKAKQLSSWLTEWSSIRQKRAAEKGLPIWDLVV